MLRSVFPGDCGCSKSRLSDSDMDTRYKAQEKSPQPSVLNGLINVLKSLSLVCEHRYAFDLPNYILSTQGAESVFSSSLMPPHPCGAHSSGARGE